MSVAQTLLAQIFLAQKKSCSKIFCPNVRQPNLWNSIIDLIYLGYLQPSVGHSTFRVISTFSQHSKWNFLRMSFNGTSPSNWGPKTRAVLLAKSLKLIFAWKQIWEFLVLYFPNKYYLQLFVRSLNDTISEKECHTPNKEIFFL